MPSDSHPLTRRSGRARPPFCAKAALNFLSFDPTGRLPEAEVNPVLAGNKAVSLYLHEEGAVKQVGSAASTHRAARRGHQYSLCGSRFPQFLFETGVVKDTDFEGGSVFTEQAS